MRLSISRIKAFKSCRRRYQLRYLERLLPVEKSEALEVGSNYHKLLEACNTSVDAFEELLRENPYSKEAAMALAYRKYIFPRFHVTCAEKWIEYDLGDGNKLVGCIDALADDGSIVEHKSVGSDITEQYEYNLQWDEQILAYMMMTGARKVYYTVCRKPTIRQKQNETEEEFFKRMIEWYDVDTDSKIRLLELYRSDAEVEQFRLDLMAMVDEMSNARNFYRNTCHCNMYGRRCEYSSVCLFYDPDQEYVEFTKGEEDYEPTEN